MAEEATVQRTGGRRRLSRWEPPMLFQALEDELERIWSATPLLRLEPMARPLRRLGRGLAAWYPRMDVFEKDGSLVVKLELPGVKAEDLEMRLEGNDLVIEGERRAEEEVSEEDYYRLERSYGRFRRSLPLPFEVTPDQVEAALHDGVLEVRIAQPSASRPEPKRITIRS